MTSEQRMLVYTLLFTLAGRAPKDNRYVEMFFIWLTYLCKNGGLTATDRICVLIDKTTVDYLNSDGCYSHVADQITIPIDYVIMPTIMTISEGMICRYNFHNDALVNETFVYLDLDVLVLRPLRMLIKPLAPNTMACMPEGRMINGLYGGCTLDEEIADSCGFSSGIFAYCPGHGVQDFFNRVTAECLAKAAEPYYTIDQPFFNKWIYKAIMKNEIDMRVELLDDMHFVNNVFNYDDNTIIMNYAGEPGNDSIHYKKMLSLLCIDFMQLREAPAPAQQREEAENPPQETSAALPEEARSHTPPPSASE